MGVIIIVFEGDCHTQSSPVIMKCLFKGAPCFLSQRKGVLQLQSPGHAACHVERASLPPAATLAGTAQLLWVWTGRAILTCPLWSCGCSQLFPAILLVIKHLSLGSGCCLVLLFLHDSFPVQLIHLSWPQIMNQSKYSPLSFISIQKL